MRSMATMVARRLQNSISSMGPMSVQPEDGALVDLEDDPADDQPEQGKDELEVELLWHPVSSRGSNGRAHRRRARRCRRRSGETADDDGQWSSDGESTGAAS